MTLLTADHDTPSSWKDEMPVTNRYTFGVAGERFFRTIKDEGRITGTRCANCDRVYVPAAIFCERCLHETDEWVDFENTGEIVTFTEVHIGIDGAELEEPELVAFIRFGDGGLIHRIKTSVSIPLEIGCRARAVFLPPDERQGSILDISHFELLDE
jgi:uncharacterized OB-fold protein